LCGKAATKPKTGHAVLRPRARVRPHAIAGSPTDSRTANNRWYERSHARRYAPIGQWRPLKP
jgi:hypothetical protein